MANILVAGPHPDDQELGMGATIALFASQGHDVLLLDMTNGEPTPFGDPATRAAEASRAADVLQAAADAAAQSQGTTAGKVARRNLGLLNREVAHTLQARHAAAGAIRAFQADILFAPYPKDAHPDHLATTRIIEDARFDAKLTKTDLPGERIYPRWLFYYYCTHLRWVADPSFLVDTSSFMDAKQDAVLAYESQFVQTNTDVPGRIAAAAVYFGSRIGTSAAEPFYTNEPLGLTGLGSVVR